VAPACGEIGFRDLARANRTHNPILLGTRRAKPDERLYWLRPIGVAGGDFENSSNRSIRGLRVARCLDCVSEGKGNKVYFSVPGKHENLLFLCA
jgi:hypothetical protein